MARQFDRRRVHAHTHCKSLNIGWWFSFPAYVALHSARYVWSIYNVACACCALLYCLLAVYLGA